MSEHYLLGSQKDDVFEVVVDAKFDPGEFEWGTRPSILRPPFPAPALVHTRSNASFTFDYDKGHIAGYEPGNEKARDVFRAGSWDDQLHFLRQWLGNVRRELETPNLWDELAKQRQLTAATEPTDGQGNSPFTAEEQQQITDHLRELRELLGRAEHLEGERLRAIEIRLDYLQEASTRMGRRDWLNIFYGSVFSWALTALISPDAAREVLIATAQGVGALFGQDIPRLPPA